MPPGEEEICGAALGKGDHGGDDGQQKGPRLGENRTPAPPLKEGTTSEGTITEKGRSAIAA